MKNITMLNYSDMKIAVREDIYSLCRNMIKSFFDESNCNLFSHTVIKNYRKKDHVISSIGSNFKWLEMYWEKYRNIDPLERKMHHHTFGEKVSLLSLNTLEHKDQCTVDRVNYCNIKSGFSVAFTHENNIIENMMFGWKQENAQNLSLEKINKLCQILKPIRKFHLEKGIKVFSLKEINPN